MLRILLIHKIAIKMTPIPSKMKRMVMPSINMFVVINSTSFSYEKSKVIMFGFPGGFADEPVGLPQIFIGWIIH
jgi:hypothetical protein